MSQSKNDIIFVDLDGHPFSLHCSNIVIMIVNFFYIRPVIYIVGAKIFFRSNISRPYSKAHRA